MAKFLLKRHKNARNYFLKWLEDSKEKFLFLFIAFFVFCWNWKYFSLFATEEIVVSFFSFVDDFSYFYLFLTST